VCILVFTQVQSDIKKVSCKNDYSAQNTVISHEVSRYHDVLLLLMMTVLWVTGHFAALSKCPLDTSAVLPKCPKTLR